MESVRACKSRSIHLSLDSRHQPCSWKPCIERRGRISEFARIRMDPCLERGQESRGWLENAHGSRFESLRHGLFTFLFHESLSLSLLPSVARRKERFTRPAIRLHTFETCVNGGREATWGNSHRGTLQRNSWKFYSWFLRERRRYIYIYIYVAPSSRKEEEQVGEINLCKCV